MILFIACHAMLHEQYNATDHLVDHHVPPLLRGSQSEKQCSTCSVFFIPSGFPPLFLTHLFFILLHFPKHHDRIRAPFLCLYLTFADEDHFIFPSVKPTAPPSATVMLISSATWLHPLVKFTSRPSEMLLNISQVFSNWIWGCLVLLGQETGFCLS